MFYNITNIKIKDFLYNRYKELSFTPFPKINLIIGRNGSGKTTLLKTIYNHLSGIKDSKTHISFNQKAPESVPVYFISDMVVSFVSNKEVVKDIEIEHKRFKSFINETQDTEIMERVQKSINDLLGIKHVEGDEIDDIKYYVNITMNEIIFVDHGEKLPLTKLSSGFLHVFYMYLKAANAYFEKAILLIETPESSLSIVWQGEFIHHITYINPDSQIFIKTHSPCILMNYIKNAVDMNTICLTET